MRELCVTNQELCIRDHVTNGKDSLHIVVVSGFVSMYCVSYVSTLISIRTLKIKARSITYK